MQFAFRNVALVLSLFATGCAGLGPTLPQAEWQGGNDELAITKAAYLGRELLSADERSRLEGRVRSSMPRILPDYAGASARMATMGVADTSFQGSLMAAGVSTGLQLLNALGPDGSRTFVGDLYLPATMNGAKLQSPGQAKSFARDYMTGNLRALAVEHGLSLECLLNCTGDTPHYVLKGLADSDGKPVPYYLALIFGPMERAGDDVLRDSALGFHPAWHGRILLLSSVRISLNERGEVQANATPFGPVASRFGAPSLDNAFGHALLRRLTEDGLYVFGVNYAYSHLVAVHGRLFHVAGSRADNFIDVEMLPRG